MFARGRGAAETRLTHLTFVHKNLCVPELESGAVCASATCDDQVADADLSKDQAALVDGVWRLTL
jgi:hypothetical protein